MKKVIYYILVMITATIILPMFIVGGCSEVAEDIKPAKETQEEPEVKVKVYMETTGEIEEMSLETYVKGVVAAEMPADFELEALKAQAVAARTYAFGRMQGLYVAKENVHEGADVCSDSTHCQAWCSGDKVTNNWEKIEKAVEETKNIIMLYDNNPINPLYHANSGGRTENCEDVWEGAAVEYLKSVKSDGEELDPRFEVVTAFKESDLIKSLKTQYPEIELNEDDLLSGISILELSDGGKVKKIKVGNLELTGTEIRSLLSLRSANFSIQRGKEGEIDITTIGFGHGVGMSQYGANYLAANGGDYEEILKHYYSGVSLHSANDM